MKPQTRRSPSLLQRNRSLRAPDLRARQSGADWPMWGGTPDRNMVSTMKGLPTTWDIAEKKNVKWVATLGSQTYGNPVVAGGHGLRRHEQRGRARSRSRPATAAC